MTPADPSGRPSGRVAALWRITFGDAALAAFVLCAVSGALLLPSFDARDPSRSIAEWLLVNPGATLLRGVHYWTAQAFLLLTLLHAWDHLRRGTEKRLTSGVWLRLVLSLPVVAFLMLSGFLLRGDTDAQQARRVLEEILKLVPLAGPLAATFAFGADQTQWQVLALQHSATATLIVWLVIIEHGRRLWGSLRAGIVTALGAGLLALLLSPGLHDGLDPVVKGPWYFLGAQELLHWTPWPVALVGLALLALLFVWRLQRLPEPAAWRAKRGLFVSVAIYMVLSALILFGRGENWRLQPGWPAGSGDLRAGPALVRASIDASAARLPLILGRPEGCMACHANVTGMSRAHQPQSIGCASCHLGDTFTLDKVRAHSGMVRVPGNLKEAARTCGQAACHAAVVPRVEHSIMATFSGVIDTDRRAFGEPSIAGVKPPHARDLGHTAADSHLRQLCVACHLGQAKTEWGPITQESRGGGCNACHLLYSPAAKQALAAYAAAKATPASGPASAPTVHPALSVQADGSHCFGCHSRSGRISTSYEGWHEMRDPPSPAELAASAGRFRQLEDERYFVRMSADVHHARGLDCIDCHTALEVMGSGQTVAHQRQALRVRCEDCHAAQLASRDPKSIDPESRKILALRDWVLALGDRIGATRSGDTLVNVVIDDQGRGRLRRKASGQAAPLDPPAAVCTEGGGHRRLSCSSCHTAWAPQCTTCHTSFEPQSQGWDHLSKQDTQGEWVETSKAFEAALPALGVRAASGRGESGGETVDTFVPGMILRLDRNRELGAPPDTVWRRLFAPIAAHTTERKARSCTSCHADPVALGYGKGKLRYEVTGGRGATGAQGRWRFEPLREALAFDGLPADAWTGFLAERTGRVSTQEGARPFTVPEQKRILTVGACLTCHAGDSAVMRPSVRDFDAVLRRRSPRCAVPDWQP